MSWAHRLRCLGSTLAPNELVACQFLVILLKITGPTIIATIAPTVALSNKKRNNESTSGDSIQKPISAIDAPRTAPRAPNFSRNFKLFIFLLPIHSYRLYHIRCYSCDAGKDLHAYPLMKTSSRYQVSPSGPLLFLILWEYFWPNFRHHWCMVS